MRIASKIRQQERYEKGLREIRQHEERKRVKSEIGRVASATRAKYVVVTLIYGGILLFEPHERMFITRK